MMLAEHPEVRPLFNQAHQASGSQQRALANGVLMYARHIDQLEKLGGLVSQIINKHVALNILPEHYPIVGGCLLRAIREVLGAEIATDAVIEAWAAAYNQLADILIGLEEKIYSEQRSSAGRMARHARVPRRAQGRGERRDHVVLFPPRRRRRVARLSSGPVHRLARVHRRRGNAAQLFALGRAERPRVSHQREARAERQGLESPARERARERHAGTVRAVRRFQARTQRQAARADQRRRRHHADARDAASRARRRERPVHFIHAARHGGVHAFRDAIDALADTSSATPALLLLRASPRRATITRTASAISTRRGCISGCPKRATSMRISSGRSRS